MFEAEPGLLAGRSGQTIIADKGYASAEFERRLADHGVELVRPARANEPRRRGAPQLRRLRQIIESVNNTLKAQLSLEDHGGHSAKASLFASSNDSSPSPPRSGTTTTATNPSSDRSPPTTTDDPLDFSI